MKKYFIIVLLMLGVFFSLQSQSWCPLGAKWHYSWWAGGLGLDAVVTYEYTKDTTLAGKTCKQIKGTFYGHWYYRYFGFKDTVQQNFRTYYTYEINKVVYAYNGNNFDTIVNYNANIGDKWLQLGRSTQCNNMVPVIVKDTGHVVINNVVLKKIVLTYSASPGAPTPTVSHTYTIIEKLGNITSIYFFADLFPQFCDVSGAIAENPTTSFKCYQDNNFPLYEISPSACNNVLGLVNQNDGSTNVAIYPNPNSGNCTIKLSYPSTINIMNALGQFVFEMDFDRTGEQQLDLSNLANGIYFVNVSNKFGQTNLKFIKE